MEEQGEVTHRFWSVSHGERVAVATTFAERVWPAIVFTRTKHGADRLAKQLKKAGVRAEAIHGDRSQSQRERALGAFGRGDVHVLVATDVAARGIHVDGVAGVLQYDAPATDKDYVHRSGRTGRAGAEGLVLTMTTPEKEKALRQLQRELRRREPVEAVTAATAAEALGVAPAKPVDRGDGLDGVPRRERPRADVERVADVGRGGTGGRRKPSHRKGTSPRQVAEADWTPRTKPRKPAAAKGRNGQARAGTPARAGRPGAKPGRRPAGAGAARPGRPAGGNGRRRSR
jgi:superfamily II DNA/RNA helicase